LRTAKILAQVVRQKYPEFDLILLGKQSSGADNAQVPAMVAELLDLPQINVVTKLEIEGNAGTAHREIEGALEKMSFVLPAVVSAQKGLNEPRYETLKGIMMAKRKEIPVLTLSDVGLGEEDLAPKLEVIKMETPPPRKAGTVVTDEPEEAAKKMAQYLHDEAKVI
jgi:electron transfer flavoprotein beta subunit